MAKNLLLLPFFSKGAPCKQGHSDGYPSEQEDPDVILYKLISIGNLILPIRKCES